MPTYTAKQQEALAVIAETIRERGIAPTLEEIGEEMGGISRVAVLQHLRELEKKGAIRRRARESRAIEVLDPDYAPREGIPLEGRIAAGEPILEVEDREVVELDEYLGIDERCFLLRVEGDSMVDAHILDGDLVLVESRTNARDGDIVVAVVGDEDVTLKRFFQEARKVRLEPANPRLRPKTYPAAEVRVRGILRGVIRRA